MESGAANKGSGEPAIGGGVRGGGRSSGFGGGCGVCDTAADENVFEESAEDGEGSEGISELDA